MKTIFQIGDQKKFERIVGSEDSATFEGGQVHPVYATFALARDAEWVCRLFVIDMKEENEEGIGTFIDLQHVSPALIGSRVSFTATLEKVEGNEVLCSFEAKVEDRLVAKGRTGQKILKQSKIEGLFKSLKT